MSRQQLTSLIGLKRLTRSSKTGLCGVQRVTLGSGGAEVQTHRHTEAQA